MINSGEGRAVAGEGSVLKQQENKRQAVSRSRFNVGFRMASKSRPSDDRVRVSPVLVPVVTTPPPVMKTPPPVVKTSPVVTTSPIDDSDWCR